MIYVQREREREKREERERERERKRTPLVIGGNPLAVSAIFLVMDG